VRQIPPLGARIESVFERFRDEKDIGFLTLTHIYLLIGCSLPLWLTPSQSTGNTLLIASGVITVGFGDTAAAVVGSLYGRHRWKGSKRHTKGLFRQLLLN